MYKKITSFCPTQIGTLKYCILLNYMRNYFFFIYFFVQDLLGSFVCLQSNTLQYFQNNHSIFFLAFHGVLPF
ncbi:hypothetical protein C1645_776127 [Glomus cerebriforme]|uniref:Uncharacterized protein n=1 Tax=Glomus cerebriforme TaxID=658196 RepID=A0A397SVS7_9GLOM|nr:hypothetical protein C1645_776127 [Glomus cerebriforme]